MIIGLSGVAGAGKDTFFKIFKKLIGDKRKVVRFALADALKKEVSTWTKKHYGICAFDCSREQKEVIRPFLVLHGVQKRMASEGRHWIEKLDPELKEYVDSDDIAIVTDIRYADFEKDEAYWIQHELNGFIVHISMYIPKKNPNEGVLEMHFVKPYNDEEARNDPKLKDASDIKVEWPKIEDNPEFEKKIEKHVQNVIDSLGL